MTGPRQLLMVGFQIVTLTNGPQLLISKKDQRRHQRRVTYRLASLKGYSTGCLIKWSYGGSKSLNFDPARVLPTEGGAAVLGGVDAAAGEGAGAGPSEGGRVSVCPQGDARQDPGHGEGGCLRVSSSPYTTPQVTVEPAVLRNHQGSDAIVPRYCGRNRFKVLLFRAAAKQRRST